MEAHASPRERERIMREVIKDLARAEAAIREAREDGDGGARAKIILGDLRKSTLKKRDRLQTETAKGSQTPVPFFDVSSVTPAPRRKSSSEQLKSSSSSMSTSSTSLDPHDLEELEGSCREAERKAEQFEREKRDLETTVKKLSAKKASQDDEIGRLKQALLKARSSSKSPDKKKTVESLKLESDFERILEEKRTLERLLTQVMETKEKDDQETMRLRNEIERLKQERVSEALQSAKEQPSRSLNKLSSRQKNEPENSSGAHNQSSRFYSARTDLLNSSTQEYVEKLRNDLTARKQRLSDVKRSVRKSVDGRLETPLPRSRQQHSTPAASGPPLTASRRLDFATPALSRISSFEDDEGNVTRINLGGEAEPSNFQNYLPGPPSIAKLRVDSKTGVVDIELSPRRNTSATGGTFETDRFSVTEGSVLGSRTFREF